MGKKSTTKAPRKTNFPMVFWDGLRERAQDVADTEHGGNLTALVNTAVNLYVREREPKKGRK